MMGYQSKYNNLAYVSTSKYDAVKFGCHCLQVFQDSEINKIFNQIIEILDKLPLHDDERYDLLTKYNVKLSKTYVGIPIEDFKYSLEKIKEFCGMFRDKKIDEILN